MDRNVNKYRIEKVLHELIRDLPEVRKISWNYKHGFLAFEDALKEIAEAVRKERVTT